MFDNLLRSTNEFLFTQKLRKNNMFRRIKFFKNKALHETSKMTLTNHFCLMLINFSVDVLLQ